MSGHHWFREWFGVPSVPSHYPNPWQYWYLYLSIKQNETNILSSTIYLKTDKNTNTTKITNTKDSYTVKYVIYVPANMD